MTSLRIKQFSQLCTSPLILEHGRQRQVDSYKLVASLVYIVSSRTSRATWYTRIVHTGFQMYTISAVFNIQDCPKEEYSAKLNFIGASCAHPGVSK